MADPVKYDWREDVWPRFRWALVVDALALRRKETEEGGWLPEGYGVAWRCWDRHAVVCMPVPLNVIVGWLRHWWIELRHGLGVPPDRDVQALIEAEQRGWSRASRDLERREAAAFERGRRQGADELRTAILNDLATRSSSRG